MEPDYHQIRRECLEIIQADIAGIHSEFKTLNGVVKRHEEEIFGDDKRRQKGLRLEMDEIHDLMQKARGVIYAVIILGGVDVLVRLVDLLRDVYSH